MLWQHPGKPSIHGSLKTPRSLLTLRYLANVKLEWRSRCCSSFVSIKFFFRISFLAQNLVVLRIYLLKFGSFVVKSLYLHAICRYILFVFRYDFQWTITIRCCHYHYRLFHIDDTPSNANTETIDYSHAFTETKDPICCICASEKNLIVVSAIYNVHQHTLYLFL